MWFSALMLNCRTVVTESTCEECGSHSPPCSRSQKFSSHPPPSIYVKICVSFLFHSLEIILNTLYTIFTCTKNTH